MDEFLSSEKPKGKKDNAQLPAVSSAIPLINTASGSI